MSVISAEASAKSITLVQSVDLLETIKATSDGVKVSVTYQDAPVL